MKDNFQEKLTNFVRNRKLQIGMQGVEQEKQDKVNTLLIKHHLEIFIEEKKKVYQCILDFEQEFNQVKNGRDVWFSEKEIAEKPVRGKREKFWKKGNHYIAIHFYTKKYPREKWHAAAPGIIIMMDPLTGIIILHKNFTFRPPDLPTEIVLGAITGLPSDLLKEELIAVAKKIFEINE